MIRKKRLPIGHLALYGWLPSPLKIWAYRVFRGYKIGKGETLAFGAVVIGDEVELGDDVEIGLLAMMMGRTIRIARHSSVLYRRLGDSDFELQTNKIANLKAAIAKLSIGKCFLIVFDFG